MKLIAKRDFRNVGNQIECDAPTHPDQVDKGTIFVIGRDEKTAYDHLNKTDKEFVGLLNLADCIGDGSDPKIVSLVMAEVSASKRSASPAQAISGRK